MSTSSDQDGFKVPSLPISRAKPHEDGGQDETKKQTAEQLSKLEDSVTAEATAQTEDKLSETQNTGQTKASTEGSVIVTSYCRHTLV